MRRRRWAARSEQAILADTVSVGPRRDVSGLPRLGPYLPSASPAKAGGHRKNSLGRKHTLPTLIGAAAIWLEVQSGCKIEGDV
jgi:hypothetical protein